MKFKQIIKSRAIYLILICLFLFGCTGSGSSTGNGTATSAAAGTEVELPATVIGKYTGTAIIGSQTSQFANAIVSKVGLQVSISFSGGKPALTGGTGGLSNLRFVTTSQNGVYDSTNTGGSLGGIHLAEYKTNLNIENVNSGGVNFVFTGVKCDVVPESVLCTCEVNPASPICQ